MSKSIKQVRVPVSPDYRIAPSSRAESVIGLMIILAVGLALVLGAEGRILLGVLVFVGALIANAAGDDYSQCPLSYSSPISAPMRLSTARSWRRKSCPLNSGDHP